MRHLTLALPAPVAAPVPLCDHIEKRRLTWVCTLPAHDDDRAHVMVTLR